LPVILAYDFSNEASRFAHLARMHPALSWGLTRSAPDAIRAGNASAVRSNRLGPRKAAELHIIVASSKLSSIVVALGQQAL
jgi:hypothetical protein